MASDGSITVVGCSTTGYKACVISWLMGFSSSQLFVCVWFVECGLILEQRVLDFGHWASDWYAYRKVLMCSRVSVLSTVHFF
jgi:hypothetical protein